MGGDAFSDGAVLSYHPLCKSDNGGHVGDDDLVMVKVCCFEQTIQDMQIPIQRFAQCECRCRTTSGRVNIVARLQVRGQAGARMIYVYQEWRDVAFATSSLRKWVSPYHFDMAGPARQHPMSIAFHLKGWDSTRDFKVSSGSSTCLTIQAYCMHTRGARDRGFSPFTVFYIVQYFFMTFQL